MLTGHGPEPQAGRGIRGECPRGHRDIGRQHEPGEGHDQRDSRPRGTATSARPVTRGADRRAQPASRPRGTRLSPGNWTGPCPDPLHTLLHRAHVPGPYVLAGHSFGGLYVRIFAARYPNEVAGMVLIDSTGSVWPASTSAQSRGPDDILARASVLASASARLGVGRLIGLGGGYGTLPPRSAAEVRAKIATSASLRSTIDEFLQANASEHETATLTGSVVPARLRGFTWMGHEQAPAPS